MKLNIQKIKRIVAKMPRKMAENSFLATIIFIIIATATGAIVFYKYNGALNDDNIEITGSLLKFKENSYQKIINKWQEKEEQFQIADLKEYPNLFVK
ncbi:hypothetical protein ACFLYY_00145 [Patescibacteria group bacterium]